MVNVSQLHLVKVTKAIQLKIILQVLHMTHAYYLTGNEF
jgi:hypothetical protein